MIIRFDHITYVEDRNRKEELLMWKKSNGWEMHFFEDSLQNIPTKKKLMKFPDETHDIYFMKKENNINTEVIFYNRVSVFDQIKVQNNIIHAGSNNLEETERIIKKLGGKGERRGDTFQANLKGILDKKDYIIIFQKKENAEAWLDNQGYGCITLLIDSIEKVGARFKTDFFYSEEEELKVNSQSLNIAFVKSKSTDLIFELISVKKQ